MEYRPLVSVIVVVYNSSAFIVETLDSIRRQTYPHIELVISDDCSKDDTVAVCNQWLLENKGLFAGTTLISSPKNGGIVQNCNQGVAASKGEWIKLIAGDDILLDNCIADFVDYTDKNRSARVVFSDLYYINNASETISAFPSRSEFYGSSADKQLELLVYDNLLPACAGFINKETVLKEGGFDPAFPMMEDYPFWLKLSARNYRMEYLPKFTIGYRIHENNTSSTVGNMNKKFLQASLNFSETVRMPLAKKISPAVVAKVRRDMLLTKMRLYWPGGYKVLLPAILWAWNIKKSIRWKK